MDLRETHIIGQRTRERLVSPNACPALSGLGIRLTGLSEARPPFRFVRLQPEMSQVLACLGGEGRVLLGRRWVPCKGGQAYLTPAYATHAYQAVGRAPWRMAWVIFSARRRAKSEAASGSGERPKLLRLEAIPLGTAIEGLYRESIGPAQPAALHAWAQVVFVLARRMALPMESDPRLWRVWEAVGADLAHPWDVPALARIAHTSSEHLRRLCQPTLGRGPMGHVTVLRLERAAALLATGDYRIEDVAYQVGYENAFAFSTAFKRQFGLPPSRYRIPR